ncbi:hypothetical protein [Geobacter sp. SVR]|uniref:hypothetical protein n=1 Tax=Geobacter sp. SVR TaxID=2495594 RepID=UPI00143EF821|nr:hypothetical protein [Geobacter sp. SVR]BCS54559.1 hypothetical protein GSVR_28670 [Geobacter sp. SVR]GCF86934.1 hypothetical protein GSbR_35340 [Geobacter sp. SVR]
MDTQDEKQQTKQPGKTSASMVAQHPLHPVENLAMERGMPATAVAGLRRATGWVEGKQVTVEQFEEAMELYRNKPMGRSI